VVRHCRVVRLLVIPFDHLVPVLRQDQVLVLTLARTLVEARFERAKPQLAIRKWARSRLEHPSNG
jgi:hypothetical protein